MLWTLLAVACFFFFNDTATTEIYTLSLHDALPICFRSPQPRSPALSLCSTRATLSPSSPADRKSTRLNSSHLVISYAVFCLKKKKQQPLERVRASCIESIIVRRYMRLMRHLQPLVH